MSLRIYHYVAPSALGTLRRGEGGLHVRGHEPLKDWIIQGGGRKNAPAERCATFIIDPSEQLWISDRRSEHVAAVSLPPKLQINPPDTAPSRRAGMWSLACWISLGSSGRILSRRPLTFVDVITAISSI